MLQYISANETSDSINTPLSLVPSIGIVVPVRESHTVIISMLESLATAANTYPGRVEIILIGSPQDKTWEPIMNSIYKDTVHILEIASDPRFRDANEKRKEGVNKALALGLDVIYFTDTKIRHPQDILSTGIGLMQQHNVQAVAGTMEAWPEQRNAYWAGVLDNGLITEMPRFGSGRCLTNANYGRSTHLPITANFFIQSVAALALLEQWPDVILPSHEDSLLAIRLIMMGYTIWCTDRLVVYHKHRVETTALMLKWWRAGVSVAGILDEDSTNSFAQQRARKAAVIMTSIIGGAIASIFLIASLGIIGVIMQIMIALMLYFLLGIVNVLQSKQLRALTYPFGTIILIITYTLAFAQSRIIEVNQEELLQIH